MPLTRTSLSSSRWLLSAALFLLVACKREPADAPEKRAAAKAATASANPEDSPFPDALAPTGPVTEPVSARLKEAPFKGDLPELQKRGVLRVLVEGTDEDSLPRQGMPKAQDRALLERFAAKQGLTVEFLTVDSFDKLIPLLQEGHGDVIAADLAVTKDREKQVAFTRPLTRVNEVLVGRKGAEGLPRTVEDLAGKTVHVRPSSTFAASLQALGKQAPGLVIADAAESVEPEHLVWQVSRGEIPLTVVDSHLLDGILTYNTDVEGLFPIAKARPLAWAMRLENPKLRAELNTFLVEFALTEYREQRFTGDLDAIRKRGVLRVLTRNSAVTYYLHRGDQAGFDFHLANMVAKELDVRLEIVVPPTFGQLIPWLTEGRGDMIAASMTDTEARRKQVGFSRPYLFTDEVIVQRAGAPKLTSLDDLKGKTLHVPKGASHFATVTALKEAHGFKVAEEPEDQEISTLLDRLAAGEIAYTVTDSHILAAEQVFRDDVELALTLPGQGEPAGKDGHYGIAFAIRKENAQLREFLDAFVKKTYRGVEYNMTRRRYFEGRRNQPLPASLATGEGSISPYDGLVQSYAARYGLDWRLMVAQMFQESRFDPKARSFVGAQGLFQVMPTTGKELGFVELEDPEQGIHAGVKYMHQMLGRIAPEIPFKQRLRFALASYNAGLGHVLDARRLATELGLDPNKWYGNVEKAMLLLEKPQYFRRARHGYVRGTEPVKYVSEIQTRYGNYVAVVQH